MDPSHALMLRELLASSELTRASADFARAVRGSARAPHGLALFGPAHAEPWHLTAHLDDELHHAGLDQLRPALVRWNPEPDAPAQLRVGLERLIELTRGSALVVVSQAAAGVDLLERLNDVRRRGGTVLSIGGPDDSELCDVSHEMLVPARLRPAAAEAGDLTLDCFEIAQHFVSMSVADDPGTAAASWRRRLRTLIEHLGS